MCVQVAGPSAQRSTYFTIHLDDYLRKLPASIARAYPAVCFPSRLAYGVELANALISGYKHPLASKHQEMLSAAALRDALAQSRYEAFIAQAAARHPAVQELALPWPARAHGSRLAAPSEDVLRRVFDKAAERIKPYVLADLVRRDPGEVISGDGTFKLAGRVKSGAKVLHFILGADHCIVAYGAVRSDGFHHVIPLYMQLRRRLEAMGKLHNVQAAYSDRCCGKRTDPATAPLTIIFPGCSRESGDGWHLANRLIEATTRGNHPDLQAFSAAVGKAIRVPHAGDLEAVKNALLADARKRGEVLHPDEAEMKAMGKEYSESVRTVGPAGHVIARNLQNVFTM